VFVPDATYPPDFDFDNRPRNRRRRLYQAADPTPAIFLRSNVPPDPRVAPIDDFIPACNEYDEELDKQGAGCIEMTPKLATLGLKKGHCRQK
jgi:hypothetical protein